VVLVAVQHQQLEVVVLLGKAMTVVKVRKHLHKLEAVAVVLAHKVGMENPPE
jgi:hypothetical protein